MTALKIIGIILLVFLLIGFLRVGATASFGSEFCVKLRIGHIKLAIFPGKEKEKKPKEKKPKEKKKKEKKPEEAQAPKEKKRSIPKPDLEELLDLADTAFSALGATARRACRRVRIDPLDVTVVFGGDDPANVAMLYGAASSVMYATMPRAEERFDISNPSLHLRMDYSAEGTTAEGAVGISLRVCDLFAILFTLALPLARWFLRFKRAHKRDSVSHRVETKEDNNNDTKDKIA